MKSNDDTPVNCCVIRPVKSVHTTLSSRSNERLPACNVRLRASKHYFHFRRADKVDPYGNKQANTEMSGRPDHPASLGYPGDAPTDEDQSMNTSEFNPQKRLAQPVKLLSRLVESVRGRTLDMLAVAYIALLVVFDGAITLNAWHLESNPLVLAIGPNGFLAVKLLGLLGFTVAYALARDHPVTPNIIVPGVIFGLAVALSNLLVVYEVI